MMRNKKRTLETSEQTNLVHFPTHETQPLFGF
jgi:hypothetical protein